MKLTIIIPAYNSQEYLDKLLEVLGKQLPTNCEVIVIDDGSKIPISVPKWVRLIRKENGGASSARNVGLDNAKGEYIAFIDSDDMVTDDYIERIMDALKDNHDYVYLSWETIGTGWNCKVELKSIEDTFPSFNLCVWNRIYKRKNIGKIRFNETKLIAEDAQFIREVKEEGKKAFVEKCIYLYRSDTPDSLTKRFGRGELPTKRTVIHYNTITKDMTDLIETVKELDKDGEVIVMTNRNEIPELARYAMVTEPIPVKGTAFIGEPTRLFTKLDMPKKTQVVIWTEATQDIGGIETFIYNFCQYMRDLYDIMVLYRYADARQIDRLSKIVECVNIDHVNHIYCDSLIINRVTDKIPDKVTAKQTIQMVHTCQMGMYTLPEGRDRYIFVSEHCRDTFGCDSGEVIHNMTYIPTYKKALLLVSATRLTSEKGRKRYQEFVRFLYLNNIPFVWLMFTNETVAIPGIMQMPPTLDIIPYIAMADYLVQLSDEESYCYTIKEADAVGTKVISTPIEVLKELDIQCIQVPFDMSEIDLPKQYVNTAYNGEYDTIEKWVKVLGNTTPTKAYRPFKRTVAEVLSDYYDIELRRDVHKGELITTTRERVTHLCNRGLVRGI